MADNSSAETISKFGVGVLVGGALYFLVRNLGFGGFGFGGSAGSRDEGTAGPRPGPSVPPVPGPPVPIPRDARPLLYVVAEPDGLHELSKLADPTSRARVEAIFRPVELGTAELSADDVYRRMSDVLRRGRDADTPPLSIDDVIARVKAGGRDDVRLISTGAIRQGTWDDVKDALMAVGIKHWLLWQEAPADRKPGQPAQPSRWDLYDMFTAVGNPDKNGHYLVEKRGTAFWNLSKNPTAPVVSGSAGNARGHYGAVTWLGASYHR